MHRAGLDHLRRRAFGVAAGHGGFTAAIIGALSYVWARLAPVRTHAAAWVDQASAALPAGVPWTAVLVVVAVALAATVTVLLLVRRPAPVRAPGRG